MEQRSMYQNKQKGFTLIELLIVVVIMGILVALAAPSMLGILESRKLKGAAELAYATLHFAKAEAIKRNDNVRVYFVGTGNTWCYGLKDVDDDADDDTCDCTVTDSANNEYCEIDGIKKVVNQDVYENITVANGSVPFAGIVGFDSMRGTAKSGNIEFEMTGGRTVKVTLSTLGRAKICSNDGVGGYSSCP
jgi:type IV fimbrial biogenesis protein FimT